MSKGWMKAWCAMLASAACASAMALDVPAALAPPANEALLAAVSARGVQIYECRSASGGAEWALVAPEAELLDDTGRVVGRHGAGPSWEANDGSRVVGKIQARAQAPVANAIPWLLLATTPTGSEGVWSKVTSVQRIDTAGGAAPGGQCTNASIGETLRVPYTAQYRLYAPK